MAQKYYAQALCVHETQLEKCCFTIIRFFLDPSDEKKNIGRPATHGRMDNNRTKHEGHVREYSTVVSVSENSIP